MTHFISDQQVAHWFAYHAPSTQDIVDAHEAIRLRYRDLALFLNGLLPEGPEKTLALRALHKASMAANACVALNQSLYEED